MFCTPPLTADEILFKLVTHLQKGPPTSCQQRLNPKSSKSFASSST